MYLLDYVEFAQAIEAAGHLKHAQLLPMLVADALYMLQPFIAQAKAAILQCYLDPAAPEMTANNDVPDLQHIHGVLNHRETVPVVECHYIRNVAMDEKFPRQQSDDLIGRHAAVRTADPQVFGRLLAGKPLEKSRIFRGHFCDPAAVVFEEVAQFFHR